MRSENGSSTRLPMVMPSNGVTIALGLEARFPGRLGILSSYSARWKDPKGMPHALDNGRFAVWSAGRAWDEREFYQFLQLTRNVGYPPRWVAVPDVVADAEGTLRDWKEWAPRLSREWGWPLAMCVQNGMTPAQVLKVRPLPDVIFVGGTTHFKLKTLRSWCKAFPRVHVGRVNSEKRLWQCHRAGAESTDGTGWLRMGPSTEERILGLIRYLERSGRGLGEWDTRGFFY
jgi:hypothetical protein